MLSVLSTNSLFALMTYAFEFSASIISHFDAELELELIQTQMTQKPMLRAEVGMRVRCANRASAE